MSTAVQRSWRIAQRYGKQTTPRARHYSAWCTASCRPDLNLTSNPHHQRRSDPSYDRTRAFNPTQWGLSRQELARYHLQTQCLPTRRQPIPGRRYHPPRQLRLQNVAPFSMSARALVAGAPETMKRKQKMGPSMSVAREKQMQELVRKQQLPDDVGILPETFIMPFGEARPSWWKNFSGRKRLERKRLQVRMRDTFSAASYRFIAVRPRPRLHLRQIPKIALDLYTQMYKAFAACTIESLRDEHCEGLRRSLRQRVLARGVNPRRLWTMHKLLSKPKLVSYKVALTPLDPSGKPPDAKEAYGIVQAVVRIHSLQSLLKIQQACTVDLAGQEGTYDILVDARGQTVDRDGIEQHALTQARPTVEYVVVQQMIKKSEPGKWMLWGMTEPTTLEKLDAEEATGDKKKLRAAATKTGTTAVA